MRLQQIETTTHTGLQKATRYKWRIVDQPGKQMLIDKNRLVVDETYQRDLKQSKVLAIVREWSHFDCGSILVANRNGTFYVVDGQHRVAAARQLPDIIQLPCLVFQTFDAKTEAKAFKGTNLRRRPLRSAETFKASIAAEDDVAIAIANLIAENGRIVAENKEPRGVRCVAALEKMFNDDPDILRAVFPLASDLCEGRVLERDIIEALFYIERRMPESAGSLTDPRWRKRLLSVGFDAIKGSIGRATLLDGKRVSKVFAIGALKAINRGLHNRLVIPTLNPEDGDE